MSAEDPEFAYLTTAGRKTGITHTVELWYRRLGDTVFFIAGDYGKHPDGRPDWVHNLLVEPRAEVRIGDVTARGRGRLYGGDEATPAREALAARYQSWTSGAPLSEWAATGHVVGVTLDD